jgi:hypothetical protein
MSEHETPEEFRARVGSVGFLAGGQTRDKVRTVTRPEDDQGPDAGRRAKQTTDELGTVITESENRQDVMVHPATVHTDVTTQ